MIDSYDAMPRLANAPTQIVGQQLPDSGASLRCYATPGIMNSVKIAQLDPAPADFMRRLTALLGEFNTFQDLGQGVERCTNNPHGRDVFDELVGCYVSKFWAADWMEKPMLVKGDLRVHLYRFEPRVNVRLPDGIVCNILPVEHDMRINGADVTPGSYAHVETSLVIEDTTPHVGRCMAIVFMLKPPGVQPTSDER